MASRIDPEIISKIRYLRSRGWSIPEINRELKISKTSILRHIKGVNILPEYVPAWLSKRGGSRRRMLLKQENANKKAKEIVGSILSPKEKILFLSALYWAEGNKKDLILTNTDPDLIRVFVNTAREILRITDDRLRISIRIYEDINPEKSLKFWSEVLNIPANKFLNTTILSGKKKGKLKYGMCRVRIIKGGDFLKEITAINKAVAELFL